MEENFRAVTFSWVAGLFFVINRRSVLLAFCPPLFAVPSVFAQDTVPASKPFSQFDNLFPMPTGNNGYEEIIRASDRLRDARTGIFPASEFTLTKKRAYLADPACQDALALLRQGVSKPMQLPAQSSQSFALSAPLRSLLRLLAVQIVVQFADGKNDAALRALGDGLRLVAPFKAQSLVALMAGNDMDLVILTPFAKLQDIWTPRDCERVIALAKQRLALPDPAYVALEAEREMSIGQLSIWRTDTNALAEAVAQPYVLNTASNIREKTKTEQLQSEQYARVLREDSTVRDRVLGELSSVVQQHYDRGFALLKNPAQRMQLAPAPEADANRHPITVALRGSFLLEASGTLRRGIENRLTMQMLAVHAAIRNYRWEFDRLPTLLTDTDITPSFLQDPFAGKTLSYKPSADGVTYRLASVGALLVDEKNQEVREPFTFPRASIPPA